MRKTAFTVIKGGLCDTPNIEKKEFVSAYITNTRLMGVIGTYIHWHLLDNETYEDLHQFFYFDVEEFGFDNYESVLGNDSDKLREIEGSLVGGLGGEKVSITLDEATYVLQKYVEVNKLMKFPMPDGLEEYKFLLSIPLNFTLEDEHNLMAKACVEIDNDYEVVNYFIMRCFGRDFYGSKFLSAAELDFDLFPNFTAATLCKNSIDNCTPMGNYRCSSLVEYDGNYNLAVTMVSVKNKKITTYKKISNMRITSREAAMMLAHSEFVSVYSFNGSVDLFQRGSTKLCQDAMITPHENGFMYLLFHPNNKHVAKKIYLLNEDVLGMYYITNNGQLIATAYHYDSIVSLERDLLTSPMSKYLTSISKYEFKEPVIYEFVQSDFVDFESFIDAIRTPPVQ